MDPAELDRWTVFDVEPSIEDWLAWANGRVDKMSWDFINSNRAHLEHKEDFEPNKVYPSRRSWERLSECLTAASLLEEASPALFNLSAAFVGFEAAVAFNDFVQNYDRQVSIKDILVDGELDKVKDFTINEHTALVEKMEANATFKEALPDEQVQNLAAYFLQLPSEVAMKLWTVMGQPDNNLTNTIRLHQSKVGDVVISSRMVEMLKADEEQ